MGGGRGYGPTHSQTLEKHFLGMDTFEICATNRFVNPKLVLEYALKREHPTLIVENKVDYGKNGKMNIPDGYEALVSSENLPSILVAPKINKATTTIITYGGLADLVINNIYEFFYEHDKLVQVLILTKIDPIPEKILKHSLENSKNIIFVEEGISGGSVGDYFISWIAQNFQNKNLKTISSKRISIPSTKTLEQEILPNKNIITNSLNYMSE